MKKEDKHSEKKRNKTINIIIGIFCITAMIFSGFRIFVWWRENTKSEEILNDISDKINVQDVEDENGNSKKKYKFRRLKRKK